MSELRAYFKEMFEDGQMVVNGKFTPIDEISDELLINKLIDSHKRTRRTFQDYMALTNKVNALPSFVRKIFKLNLTEKE